MQASLEAEAKAKAEALRLKKKLESDINELEIALDHSNKANADLQKQIKKLQSEMKDLQIRVEEEQRLASEYREQYGIAERRANALNAELEESRTLLEQSDRGRRQAEAELAEATEAIADLNAQNASLNTAKRKLEGEMQTLHVSVLRYRLSEINAKTTIISPLFPSFLFVFTFWRCHKVPFCFIYLQAIIHFSVKCKFVEQLFNQHWFVFPRDN